MKFSKIMNNINQNKVEFKKFQLVNTLLLTHSDDY